MMMGVAGAAEVQFPTCFMMLRRQLPEDYDRIASQLQLTYDGSRFDYEEHDERLRGYVEHAHWRLREGISWLDAFAGLEDVMAKEGLVGAEALERAMRDLIHPDGMWLYLIDELTQEPVRAEGYPILVTDAVEVLQLVPLMQVGLRAMCLCSGVVSLGRTQGSAVRQLPQNWCTRHQDAIEVLKQVCMLRCYPATWTCLRATCTCPCTREHAHASMHTRVWHVHAHSCTRSRTRTRASTCTRARARARTHAHVHTCTPVYART